MLTPLDNFNCNPPKSLFLVKKHVMFNHDMGVIEKRDLKYKCSIGKHTIGSWVLSPYSDKAIAVSILKWFPNK